MLTVHHLGISQSDRIVWLCEELQVPYQFIRYQRDPVTMLAPPEYKALHPCQTAPVITDGALALGESGAIIEYIIRKYGGGRLAMDPQQPGFPDYLYWFHFANGSMMLGAILDFAFTLPKNVEDNATIQSLRSRYDRSLAQVEARLGQADYFAGAEFSAADIIMLFPLTTMRYFVPRDLAPYPNIRRYLQRIGARPAYQRAMAKADPDLAPMLT